MSHSQDQTPANKEHFVKPSPGRFRNPARALKEGVAGENAARHPQTIAKTIPEDAGLDECQTATYWG